jgi:periplasmic protein CpxP/Spy
MKKQLFCSLLAIVTTVGSLMAQGMDVKAPKERAMETLTKVQTSLTLTSDQAEKAYPIFENFYASQQNAMAEMRASGSMDRTKMKETRDKIAAERDAKLKTLLSQDQMKKWIDEVEPSLRPQRRGGDQKPS